MQNRTRDRQLIIRVTPDERALIRKKMEKAGLTNFNAYARKMLLGGYVVHVDLSEFQALAKEVNKVGVNINQIAKFSNSIGGLFAADINEMKEQVNEIWLLLKSYLSKLVSKSR